MPGNNCTSIAKMSYFCPTRKARHTICTHNTNSICNSTYISRATCTSASKCNTATAIPAATTCATNVCTTSAPIATSTKSSRKTISISCIVSSVSSCRLTTSCGRNLMSGISAIYCTILSS